MSYPDARAFVESLTWLKSGLISVADARTFAVQAIEQYLEAMNIGTGAS